MNTIRGNNENKIEITKFVKHLRETIETENCTRIATLLENLRGILESTSISLKLLAFLKAEFSQLFKTCGDKIEILDLAKGILETSGNILEKEIVCSGLSSLGEIMDPLDENIHRLSFLISKLCSKGYREKLFELIMSSYVSKGFLTDFDFFLELGGKITNILEEIINPNRRSIEKAIREISQILGLDDSDNNRVLKHSPSYVIDDVLFLAAEGLSYLISKVTVNKEKIQSSLYRTLIFNMRSMDTVSIKALVYLLLNNYHISSKSFDGILEKIFTTDPNRLKILTETLMAGLLKYKFSIFPYYSYSWDNVVKVLNLEISEGAKFYSLVESGNIEQLRSLIMYKLAIRLIDLGINATSILKAHKIFEENIKEYKLLTDIYSKLLTELDISRIDNFKLILTVIKNLKNSSVEAKDMLANQIMETLLGKMNPVIFSKIAFDTNLMKLFFELVKSSKKEVKDMYNELLDITMKLELIPEEIIDKASSLVVR
ncbi:MAG: hypothetical protein ACP6IP_04420 [Candidatus Njordarchaeia archaeon]